MRLHADSIKAQEQIAQSSFGKLNYNPTHVHIRR